MKNKVKTNIVYEGHSFDSFDELSEFIKSDPNSDVLVWDYQERQDMVFVNGKKVLQGKQGRGKCTYKGKTYEGEVEYIGNKLYVGGKYVKDM